MTVRYVKKSVTSTGALAAAVAPGDEVFSKFAIQVKGTGAAPTSWSVTLDGSLDGVNWSTIATHNTGDGSMVFAVDKPATHFRANVGTLTLGSATDISVVVVGTR